MFWRKCDLGRAGAIVAGVLLLLVLIAWVPLSTNAYEGTSGLAVTPTATATPAVDLTVTALAKEQLELQVKQLQNQLQDQNNWFENNSTALIAAAATVIVAMFGILQWAITVRQAQDKARKDRENERQKERDAQNKELRAQAEERFKTAVTALGDEKESVQVGGAILLRSFLNEDDKEVYGRYYAQIFDLAVAYLRPSNTSLLVEDSDSIPLSSEDLSAPAPLNPFRQALVIVFREVFPLAREEETSLSQDATGIQLDHADLMATDLKHARMPYSSLRKANFSFALLQEVYLRGSHLEGTEFVGAQLQEGNFTIAHLKGANFNGAHLEKANLGGASLTGAYFEDAKLRGAILGNADLTGAHLSGADLSKADLTEANLSGVIGLEEVRSLDHADMQRVTGLTGEQLITCKAKGAIVDVETAVKAFQKVVPPPTSPQQSS